MLPHTALRLNDALPRHVLISNHYKKASKARGYLRNPSWRSKVSLKITIGFKIDQSNKDALGYLCVNIINVKFV